MKQHTVKSFFKDLRLVIRQRTSGVGGYGRLAVLRHDQSILIIFVRDGKSSLFETIEEAFLGVAVVVKSFVIINVVACEISEECAVKVQTRDALLGNRVTAHFHECVLATCVHHAAQETIECYGVRSGVGGGYCLIINIINHGG